MRPTAVFRDGLGDLHRDVLCPDGECEVRWRTWVWYRGAPTEREFDVTVTGVSEPHVPAWEGGDPQLFSGRHRFTLTAVADGTRLVDEAVFSGAMAEAVLGGHRAALAADYLAGAEALKKAVGSGQVSSESSNPRPAAS